MKTKYLCAECGEVFGTIRAVHWHLRREHDFTAEEAFDAAGESAFEGERPRIAKDFENGLGSRRNWD